MNTLQFLDPDNEYEITIDGRVISHKTAIPRERKPIPTNDGYLCITIPINGNIITVRIHQLVALTYLEPQPSPKHQLRHLDGNKLNNHATNLAWGTAKENKADSIRHGTAKTPKQQGPTHAAACMGPHWKARKSSCEPRKRDITVQAGQLPLTSELASSIASVASNPGRKRPSTRRRHNGAPRLQADLEASSLQLDLE